MEVLILSTETFAAFAAGAAALAALVSLCAAFKSNAVAQAALRIENDRRHRELQPQLSVAVEYPFQKSVHQAHLRFRLVGPANVGPVRVTVEILSDVPGDSKLAGAPPRKDVEAHVWGPAAFRVAYDDAPYVHTSAPYDLGLGDYKLLGIWASTQPDWDTSEHAFWSDRYWPLPLMLRITCTSIANPKSTWIQFEDIPGPLFT